MERGNPDARVGTTRRIRIWDRPTRVFHWALVALFAVCIASGVGGRFEIHVPAGQALLVLLVARVVWGLVGSETSRLSRLVRPPSEVAGCLRTLFRRTPDRHVGHNPLGGLSVAVMIVALAAQCLLGLFSVHVDGLHEGPLALLVSHDLGRQAAEWHDSLGHALLFLVGLHLLAVLFHLVWKRENLTAAMLTGRAPVAPEAREPRLASDRRAFLVLVLSALGTIGAIRLAAALF